METIVFVGILAIAGAFGCLYCAALAVGVHVQRRQISLAVQGERASIFGLIGWRMRNGFKPLLPVSRRLLEFKAVESVMREATSALLCRGQAALAECVLSVALAGLIMLFALSGLVAGSLIAAFAVVACVVAVASVVAGNARDKRDEAIREEVPHALESMSACFGSGFTLLQTFEHIAKEIPGGLGAVFQKCAHILETGGSAEQALRELREGAHASELAFVAVALDVQHQNGGTLKQVLEAASDSVKGELALRRSLRVQTAQAKLSARVVVVMPFVLIAAFSLASPDFLSPFFASPAGYALLGLAVLMQAGGIVLVRHALSVDGVS